MTVFLNPYHLDEYLADLEVPLAPEKTIQTELDDGDVWHHMATLYRNVADHVAHDIREGNVPIVMSGDCTTSYGVVAGMQHAGVNPSIVWFDAHGDVQTLETSHSGYIGGMPLRFLTGYRPDLVADRIGLDGVADRQIVLADARDLDPPEAEHLIDAEIQLADISDVPAVTPDGSIYLHIDFDVVNPDHLPGLRYPAAGGCSLHALTAAIKEVMATGRVAGVGFACTWYPNTGAAQQVRDVTDTVLAHATKG